MPVWLDDIVIPDKVKKELTTLMVAKLCALSVGEIRKAFNTGELKGHLCPGAGRFRRFPKESVFSFAKSRGIILSKYWLKQYGLF